MDKDAEFMARPLPKAKKSAEEGAVPVGACLTRGDELVYEGYNRRV